MYQAPINGLAAKQVSAKDPNAGPFTPTTPDQQTSETPWALPPGSATIADPSHLQVQPKTPTGTGDGWSPKASGLWDVLWNRSQQNIAPNAHDPIIAGQVNAYGAQQQRDSRHYINEMAERGGPTANLAGERRMANEHASQATGALQSQLMQNELNARRGEVQGSLGQLGSMVSDQDSRALQEALGMGQLGLQASDRANYWDALRSGLV